MKPAPSVKSYPLPFPFPPGKVWAALNGEVVMNMIYMTQPDSEKVSFSLFRQRSRALLAKDGVVWTGEVKSGRFVPSFESTDVRHTKILNAARRIDG